MSHSPLKGYDPTATEISMRDFKRYVSEIGGRWRISGANELIFTHSLTKQSCIAKANRTTTTRAMITWLRHLVKAGAELRKAFGFTEE